MSTPLLAGTVRPPADRPAGAGTGDGDGDGPRVRPAAPSWFRETPASPEVAEAVVARWVGVGGWDRTLRVLPDGCADLIWAGDRLIVVGAHPGPQRFAVPADGHNVGLRLRPGAGGAVLGVPLSDLPPGAVAAADLWGPAASCLEDDLHHGRDVDHRHQLLERHVARCLRSRVGGRGVDPAVVAAAQ